MRMIESKRLEDTPACPHPPTHSGNPLATKFHGDLRRRVIHGQRRVRKESFAFRETLNPCPSKLACAEPNFQPSFHAADALERVHGPVWQQTSLHCYIGKQTKLRTVDPNTKYFNLYTQAPTIQTDAHSGEQTLKQTSANTTSYTHRRRKQACGQRSGYKKNTNIHPYVHT